jgi:hypothetical protein
MNAIIPLRFALIVCSAMLLAGCQPDVPPDTEDWAVSEAPVQSPEEEMRATLESIVQAQARHYQDHNQYAANTVILQESYGFQPTGSATVIISFSGTAPARGYLASAIHPDSDLRCDVYHGDPIPERQQIAGEIACERP